MSYPHGFGPFTAEVHRAAGAYPLRDGLDHADAATGVIPLTRATAGNVLRLPPPRALGRALLQRGPVRDRRRDRGAGVSTGSGLHPTT